MIETEKAATGTRRVREAPRIRVGCCVPPQQYDVRSKLEWLNNTLATMEVDAFFLPQEWLGGHYLAQLAAKHKNEMPLHWERGRIEDVFGEVAQKHKVALGVGACILTAHAEQATGMKGGTEDYLYFQRDGKLAGWHWKFALPAYDDIRSKGAGRLWPETDYARRIRPVDLDTVSLRVGTVFCWEIYSRTIIPAYSFNDVNLIVHPIKFAPRGWLKKGRKSQVDPAMQYRELGEDETSIVGFDQKATSQDWLDRLVTVAHYEALCPIAISCNTWDIGKKYMALTGHVDPFAMEREIDAHGAVEYSKSLKQIVEESSEKGAKGHVHTFTMNPTVYSAGINNAFSAGAYKEATGGLEGLNHMQKATMSIKMRRLEAHLIGGTTKLDVALHARKAGDPRLGE